MQMLGITALTLGLTLMPLALLPDDSSTQTAIIAGGGGLALVGIIVMLAFQNEIQQGTGVQWTPGAAGAAPGEQPAPVQPPM